VSEVEREVWFTTHIDVALHRKNNTYMVGRERAGHLVLCSSKKFRHFGRVVKKYVPLIGGFPIKMRQEQLLSIDLFMN